MTTPTQGDHAQTELAHAAGLESFSESLPAYGFNPQPLKDAAATIRRLHAQVAALTAQPAAPQGVAYAGPETLGVYCGIASDDVTDPTHPRYVAGFKAGHAAGKKRASNGQAPACKGSAGECTFNGACMYACGAAPAGAARDPWREHLAEQADLIDCEALQRSMVQHGISFPEGGMEHFRAALGEMVNRFVRFAAPTAHTPAAQADSVLEDAARWQFVESAPSAITLRLHNLRPDQREQYVDAARKQGGKHD